MDICCIWIYAGYGYMLYMNIYIYAYIYGYVINGLLYCRYLINGYSFNDSLSVVIKHERDWILASCPCRPFEREGILKILFMTVRNAIISSHFPIMNDVSKRFSKQSHSSNLVPRPVQSYLVPFI